MRKLITCLAAVAGFFAVPANASSFGFSFGFSDSGARSYEPCWRSECAPVYVPRTVVVREARPIVVRREVRPVVVERRVAVRPVRARGVVVIRKHD